MVLPSDEGTSIRHVKSASFLDNLVQSEAKISSDDSSTSSKSNKSSISKTREEFELLNQRAQSSNISESTRRYSGSNLNQGRDDEDTYNSNDSGVLCSRLDHKVHSEEYEDLCLEKPGKLSLKDAFQILKFSYILQESAYKDSDISSVPRVIEELWFDIKKELKEREIFEECSKSVRHNSLDCVCHNSVKNECIESSVEGEQNFEDRSLAKDCPLVSDLQNTLNELINEGLLDSILPHLEPTSSPLSSPSSSSTLSPHHQDSAYTSHEEGRLTSSAKSRTRKSKFKPSPSISSLDSELLRRRPSLPRPEMKPKITSRDVTIHVCDEVQGMKKDFSCPQHLLLSQMGYFKDITSGQSLEDLDISVHCDVFIFEWLISWIKEDEKPDLEPENVISILISADFLQINPLVETALSYVHRNMNKILSVTTSLSILSDHLLTRLSELYKPSEVEMILDRKDRIQSRLYCKLITRLSAANLPQYDKEILETAFSLHRCELCGFYLTSSSAKTLPCHSLRSKIDHRGNIVPIHKRDPSFNMNEFLKALRLELKSWRKVFWRLWGMIHILYCSLCGVYFPVYLHEFCSFHPSDPEFDGIQFKNSTHPFGQYDCCKSNVFRFQTLSPSSRGCQSREHRVKLRADRDKKTYRILLAHREIICLVPFRKGGLRISSDLNSITLPTNNVRMSSGRKVSEDMSESVGPFKSKRGLIDRSVLETSGPSRTNASSNSRPTNKSMKRNPSSLYLFPGDENVCAKDSSLKAASSYGRLKREPKLPPKKFYQSSSSSSSSEDDDDDEEEDGSEEGNSSIADLDHSEEMKVASNPPLVVKDVSSVEIKVEKDILKGFESTLGTIEHRVFGLPSSSLLMGRPNVFSQKSANDTGPSKESITSSWISDRSTRANQDQQRENEENVVRDILRYLCRKQLSHSKQTDQTQSTTSKSNPSPEAILAVNRVWSSGGSIPQLSVYGGSFLRLEQDWKETHLSYLQHRTSSSSTIPQGRIRPLSAVSGLRVATRMRVSKSLANLTVQN